MIGDHFKKPHLDKLFDLGFRKADNSDRAVVMDYQSRGEAMRAYVWHCPSGFYEVGVVRLATGTIARASIPDAEFPEWLEEEFIHAEPEDESSGSGG